MNTSKKLTAALAAVIGLGAATVSLAPPASAQVPPQPPIVGGQPHRGGERHPELRRALRTLQRTEADLRRSANDFGGHKEKAADLCRQAQEQIQLALQSDRN